MFQTRTLLEVPGNGTPWLTSAALTDDSSFIAAGDDWGRVSLWSAAGRRFVYTAEVFEDSITGLSFAVDGACIVGCGADCTVRLWKRDEPWKSEVLTRHYEGVRGLTVTPDGKMVATAGQEGSVRLMGLPHAASRAAPARRVRIGGALWRRARLIAWAVGRLGTENSRCHFNILKVSEEPISCLDISPDGTLLAAGCLDNRIYVWSLPKGKQLAILSGHKDSVLSVRFSPDGKLLASGGCRPGWDTTVRVWEPRTAKAVAILDGHKNSVECLAFSPDGALLFSGSHDKQVKCWSVGTYREVRTLSGHSHFVEHLAIDPRGEWLASADLDGRIKVWEIATGQLLVSLEGHEEGVVSLLTSKSGDYLLSGSRDRRVILWQR